MVKQIANHFGIDNQMIKTVEELAELSQVICKIQLDGMTDQSYENLVEEIGDVEIMIDQLKLLHNISEYGLNEIKEEKIERTMKRHKIRSVECGR